MHAISVFQRIYFPTRECSRTLYSRKYATRCMHVVLAEEQIQATCIDTMSTKNGNVSFMNTFLIFSLTLTVRDSNYDILALSESWLNSTVTNAEVEIKGFKLTRLDRLGKTGGGVCVYSKSSIKVKCLKNITGISEFGFHQLWMLIQLRKLRSILR